MISSITKLRSALILAGISIVCGCSETRNSLSPQSDIRPAGGRLIAMTSCGASFRVISDETDSLMTPYGIGATSDTVDVCESWTGSDYDYQATGAGSSDNLPGFGDTVQTVTYQGGYVTGYTQSGGSASDPSPVGSTSFDFVKADDPTRQASYDDPYYGVSSHDPSTCLQAPCPTTMAVKAQQAALPPSGALSPIPLRLSASAGLSDTLFTRHGLSRRGVRALVNDSEEITPSAEGYRRFRTITGNVTLVRSIDRVTQLLMAEESTSPEETMTVSHKWTKVVGGYLLDRSDYLSIETIDGKQIRNFGSVQLKNVQVSDPAYPPLSLPTPSN
jgi:hypothetical protein